MSEQNNQSATPPEPARTRVRRLALAVLFTVILLIPRLRRLRRRPRAWLVLRAVAGLGGAALIWRFTRAGSGLASLISGIALVALAALVRARPLRKTSDDVARELDALVVVNGGDFSAAGNTHHAVSIFVHPERLLVLAHSFEPLAEIPLAGLRHISTGPAGANGHRGAGGWELKIDWNSGGPQEAHFHYQGTFAEHLARVAGQTIISVWKRNLPVVRS